MVSESFCLRRAKPEEAVVLADLEAASFHDGYTVEQFRLALSSNSYIVIVAVANDGAVLGFSLAEQHLYTLHLIDTAVKATRRGLGIGTALTQSVLDTARSEENIAVAWAEVRESNIFCQRSLLSLGFLPTETLANYYDRPRETAVKYVRYGR